MFVYTWRKRQRHQQILSFAIGGFGLSAQFSLFSCIFGKIGRIIGWNPTRRLGLGPFCLEKPGSATLHLCGVQYFIENDHFFFTEKPKIIDNFTRHPALYLGTACERELPMVFSKVVLCALFSSKFDFLITLAKIKCIEY